MVDNAQVPGGNNTNSGGEGDESVNNDKHAESGAGAGGTGNTEAKFDSASGDKVSYETYKKAVDDLKRWKSQAEELEGAKKAQEEEALKKKGDLAKLLELREKELAELKESQAYMEQTLTDGSKLDTFLDSMKAAHGTIPKHYWGLVDLSSIVIDPNTGMPDPGSVKEQVTAFAQQYPEVISPVNGKGSLPGESAKRTDSELSYEQWLKLPLAEKRKRIKEVKLQN